MSPTPAAATPANNSGSNSGIVLEPQPHGGALRRGGYKNPNAGRKPAAIRKKALKMLWERMDLIGHMADGAAVEFTEEGATKLVSPKPGERLQALKLLKEMGLQEAVSVAEIRDRLRRQLAVIREQETWTQADLIAALEQVWK